MRSKAPLVLMEQLVMVLVFALAATLCMRAFVMADQRSRWNEARDQAFLAAQSAAETLKSCGGDYQEAADLCCGVWDGSSWQTAYHESWRAAAGDDAAYVLRVTPKESGSALLGRAEVGVFTIDGEQLCVLPVAWQEVADNG